MLPEGNRPRRQAIRNRKRSPWYYNLSVLALLPAAVAAERTGPAKGGIERNKRLCNAQKAALLRRLAAELRRLPG